MAAVGQLDQLRLGVEDAIARGLRVGDVLLYADTELWLAGMVELWEEDLVARLFPTPGALRSA